MKEVYKDRPLFIVGIVFLLCLFFLAGCTSTENTQPVDSAEKSEYKIAMVANAPIADGGWNSSCYKAMVDAAAKNGFETAYSENVAQTDYVSMFREYANMGFDIVFAPGNEFTDAVVEIASDYPEVSFVLLNGEISDVSNITSALPDNYQHGLLAGVLAALQTNTNSVGFVGGMEITSNVNSEEGFKAGVALIDPDIKIASVYADSFNDTAKGKEIASSMVSTSDVDVIFGVASAVDAGVRDGLSEYENRWNIAQPSELLHTDPQIILTSLLINYDTFLDLAMQDVINGTFGEKTIIGNLANGCIEIGEFGSALGDAIKAEFLDYAKRIEAGEFDR